MYTLQELPPPSSTHLLKGIDLRNDLVKPSVDATMTPDSTSVLRESIHIRPTPRPRCAMLPRPSVIDVVEEHRTALETLQPVSTPKTTPTSGRATLNATVIQSGRPRFRISPGVARTSRPESITTNKLQTDASKEEMTLNATID
jgi:hypothetical protein